MKLLRVLLLSLGVVAIVETLLSTIRSNLWWLQVLDFPRRPVSVVLLLLALACALVLRRWRWPMVAALLLAAGWQFWRYHEYTAFASPETSLAEPSGDCFTALGLNVFQHNRDYARTLAMLRRERPDLLLLMETDSGWARALEPLLARYPYRAAMPLPNTYGMIFASRLPIESARMPTLTDANTPTLHAVVRTRAGRRFSYIGLHPRPPLPGQSTAMRDAKIIRAAREASGTGRPTLAMGDFNAVAWSHTTRLFRQLAGLRDPRIGRGMYPTFPANHVWLGWPLDHVFATPDFTFGAIRALEDVGSDHRPLATRVCLSTGGKASARRR